MKTAVLATIGCILLLTMTYAVGPADPKTPPAPAEKDKADLATLADGCNAFATDLYAQLAAKPGNLFFSPASIDTALGMTYAGAAGNTADQMAKTLHFTLPADKLHPAFAKLIADLNNPTDYEAIGSVTKPAYQLSVANALWGEKGYDFKPAFLGLLKETYKAGLNEVDFKQSDAARKTINDWVAKETKDKIKDLIPAGVLTRDTRLVLTNAIYFKSGWAEEFTKHATKNEEFMIGDLAPQPRPPETVTVPLMHKTAGFGYAETDDVQVLSLPYKAGQLDMVVLLPKMERNNLANLEKSLGRKLGDWLKAIKHEEVIVTLPKFKFNSQFKLSDTLKAMGMTDAFDIKASFPGITTKEALFIQEVVHKAFVAVDEEGTEAAAATAVALATLSAPIDPPTPKVFKADHPFLFMIRHTATKTILFMGRVADPKG
jgi:serpin B